MNPYSNIINYLAYNGKFSYPYQTNWGNNIEYEDKTAILASRRVGKSYGIADSVSYLGEKYAGIPINIFSPTQLQSKRFLEYVSKFYNSTKRLKKLIHKDNKTFLELKTGTRYEIFGEKGNIDSAGSAVIILEEMGDMNQEIINTRILPTLAAKNPYFNGKIIATGTAKYKNDPLYRIFVDNLGGYKRLPIVTYLDGIKYGNLNQSTVEMIRSGITISEFNKSFKCIWDDDDKQFFSDKLIINNQSYDRYNIENVKKDMIQKSVIGYDVGGNGKSEISKHVIIILSLIKNKWYVTKILEYDRNTKTEIIENHFSSLWYEYKCTEGLIDAYGAEICYNIQKQIWNEREEKHLPLQPYRFNQPSKHQIFNSTKISVEKNNILLPYNNDIRDETVEKFLTQIKNIVSLESKTNLPMYKMGDEKLGDDHPDAFCLAGYLAREQKINLIGGIVQLQN